MSDSDWMDDHDETVDELNAAQAEIERLRAALRLACTPPWPTWTNGTEQNINALIGFHLRMADLQKAAGGGSDD